MINYIRSVLVTLAIGSLLACAHQSDTVEYRDVPFEDLMARPWYYEGTPVRVRGYMVSLLGGIQLLDVTWNDCYGSEPDRKYVTTTLPESVLGEWSGAHSEYDGRLVTVVGIIDSSPRPWPDYRNFSTPPEYEVVGPLRRARIEVLGEERCRRIDERP
jgi:hypothetical protein